MSARTRHSPRPRRALTVALAALALVLTACSNGDGEPKETTLPAPMPELTLSGFAGQPDRNLAEIDTPTLVSLWASWCIPCRKEMPVMEEFHQKYRDQIDVLGINFQEPRSKAAEELVTQTGVTYPLVTDFNGDIDGNKPFPRVGGLPLLAFVDGDGQLVGVEYVLFDDLSELEEVVGKHLDLAPPGQEDDA